MPVTLMKNQGTKITSKRPGLLLKILLVLVIIGFLGVAVLGLMNIHVYNSSSPDVYSLESFTSSSVSSDAHYDAVIVLGCAVWEGGVASPMLADRLRTAAAVFKTGCADYVLVTGDSENPEDYDETGCMKEFLINEGISESDILCDPLGLSTYDSMLRAVTLFNVKSAVVVTTSFHCERSVYDARNFGIESVGVEAINSGYVIRQYNYYREFIARGKDFVFMLIKPGY